MTGASVGTAFARAGLLGNPSDGFDGKALACPVRNFRARVSVTPSDRFTIAAGGAAVEIPDLDAALGAAIPAGVEGLERLVLAATKRLAGALDLVRPPSPSSASPFAIRCSTTVPRQVGLAGSSAVIIATLRALAAHWGIRVEPFDLAEMALATEVSDLGIAAGPMDRVIQAYERVTVMDLASPRTEAMYQPLDAGLLGRLLVAWVPDGGRSSHVTHSDLRARWDRGDSDVVDTMRELRGVVDRGVAALRSADHETFADLVDHNFELRCRLTSVSDHDREMVALARRRGAAAKLCGSGGAVLVVPRSGVDLADVDEDLGRAGFHTCRPTIA